MKIIGWIREGDKATCRGTVAEGLKTCTSHGVPYTYQGARMACRKNCVIVEGFARSTLPNGRSRVIHGMVTSGGCSLYSTLNDVDGVVNESGDVVAAAEDMNEAQAASFQIATATQSGVCLDCLIKAVHAGSPVVIRE
jgi:uncharacterized Zn-binding protein involved in type VI secretion